MRAGRLGVGALTLLLACACEDSAQNRFEVVDDRIHDQLTGKVWEATLKPGAISWNDAVAFCDDRGMRLPVQDELTALFDIENCSDYSCAHTISITGVNEEPGAVWSLTSNDIDESLAVVCTPPRLDGAWLAEPECFCRVDAMIDKTTPCPTKDQATIVYSATAVEPIRVWCVE
jgi:hypothetical protein